MQRRSRGGRRDHGGGGGGHVGAGYEGDMHQHQQMDLPMMGGYEGNMQQQHQMDFGGMRGGMMAGPGPGSQQGFGMMGSYPLPPAPGMPSMSPHDFQGPPMGGMGPPPFGGPGFPGPPGFEGFNAPMPPPRGAFGGPNGGGKGKCFTCGQEGHWARDCPQNAGIGMSFPRKAGKETEANDFCQHFVDTGQRPQNFLVDAHLADRLEEYPKLKQLVAAADEQVEKYCTPAYSLRADLRTFKLSNLGTKFDTILIDPPWEEYLRRAPGFVQGEESWTWQEIRDLDVGAVADYPCFLFLWCGSAEGLDAGRHCMQKWGFKRIEDICWIKTNRDANRKYLSAANQELTSILTRTKEHCLVGLKGSVRRGPDNHYVHTNFDTDVIVSEEPPLGSTIKPEELYHIIERFAMGRRRLELFGEDHNGRPGWVTVGNKISTSNYKPHVYLQHFLTPNGMPWKENNKMTRLPVPPAGAPTLVPPSEEIEQLRPRTPPDRRQPDVGMR